MKNFSLQKNKACPAKFQRSGGFSTLLIVIILGSMVLSLTLALSTSSVWSIRGSTNVKNSNQAKALVNACAEVALEAMRENNSYVGTNSVTLSGNTCNYTVTNTGGTARGAVISGTVNNIIRKLNITTSSFNPLIISLWQEVQ